MIDKQVIGAVEQRLDGIVVTTGVWRQTLYPDGKEKNLRPSRAHTVLQRETRLACFYRMSEEPSQDGFVGWRVLCRGTGHSGCPLCVGVDARASPRARVFLETNQEK